jgi:hypothetical protein
LKKALPALIRSVPAGHAAGGPASAHDRSFAEPLKKERKALIKELEK